MKPERIALMPNWPARMDEGMAASYMGVGLTMFRERVKQRKYPQPVTEGRRLLWSRVQLDRFIESQFGIGPASEDPTWDDVT